MSEQGRVAVIGAGPAGLMAAEALAARGFGVDIYDAMASFGRKFLMAGKSGLNISHAEDQALFLRRYICADPRLAQMVAEFGADEVVAWMRGLGIAAHTGPSGRIFPRAMKASPLLRAWLARLGDGGAVMHTRHRWQGWDSASDLVFDTPDGLKKVAPAAMVLALGGASWKRLGADGAWAQMLTDKGVKTIPFQPSNCGFTVAWSDHIKRKFAGAPVKSVRLSAVNGQSTRSEFVITRYGVESGGVYTLSAALREDLAERGAATLTLDLLPDLDAGEVLARLTRPGGKRSLSNHLRKVLGLNAVKLALIYEIVSAEDQHDPAALARLIKALPLAITGTAPLDQAISVAGGISWEGLDDALMLRAMPGVFCAGEMLDWDAPTGGYLITACLATGQVAGAGAAQWLNRT